jgi:hypothetical protein
LNLCARRDKGIWAEHHRACEEVWAHAAGGQHVRFVEGRSLSERRVSACLQDYFFMDVSTSPPKWIYPLHLEFTKIARPNVNNQV